MRQIIIAFITTSCFTQILAQDTIFTIKRDVIIANISNIGDKFITYSPNGRSFVKNINTSKVTKVVRNGETYKFETEESSRVRYGAYIVTGSILTAVGIGFTVAGVHALKEVSYKTGPNGFPVSYQNKTEGIVFTTIGAVVGAVGICLIGKGLSNRLSITPTSASISIRF